MKVLVLNFVLCAFSAALVDALSSEEVTSVTETCCNHAEGLAMVAASAGACAEAAPPEEIEPDQLITCKAAIVSCCDIQFKEKDVCAAGMKLAVSKQCHNPKTDTGKMCCEECSFGRLTGERQGVAECVPPSAEGMSFSSFMRKNAYYQCCLEAAEKPTTTEQPVATTTEKKRPKETCSKSACDHNCDDEGGIVRCSCKEGFRLQSDKKSCMDINECAEAVDDLCLVENTVCHNVPGAFKCVPIKKRDVGLSCPPGFKRNVVNQVCDDINECQLPRPPCPKYLCENTIGGYKCAGKPGKPFEEAVPGALKPVTEPSSADTPPPKSEICPPGFRAGANDECLDIDECTETLDDCQRLSQHCINTHGSFFCQDHVSKRCAPGFKVNSATGICEDIDECEESSELCKRSEVCVNLPGAYNCKSKISQLPKLATNTCQEGTRLRPGGKICEDIDECREGSHLCDQFQNCINTFGAHECRCKNGFELDSSSGSCVDIDECSLKLDNCGPGLYCLNDLGSFACTRRAPSTTTSLAPPLYEYEYYDSSEENITDDKTPVPEPRPIPKPIPTLRPIPRTTLPPTLTPSPSTTPKPTTPPTTRPFRPYPPYPDRRHYTNSTATTRRPPYTPARPTTPPPTPETPTPRPTTPSPRPETPTQRPTTPSPRQTTPPTRPATPPTRPETPPPRPTLPARPATPPTRAPPTRPVTNPPSPTLPPRPTTPSPRPTTPSPRPTTPSPRPTTPTIKPETPSSRPDSNPTRPDEAGRQPEYSPPEPDYRRPSYDPYGSRPSRPDYSRRPVTPRPYPTPTNRPETPRTEPTAKPTTTDNSNRVDDPFNPDDVHCLYGIEKDAFGNCVEKATTVDNPLDPKEVHCLNGYESDVNGNCVDVDECKSGRHICGSLEKCINRAGGYTCECVAGFVRGDDGWCMTKPFTPAATTTDKPVAESTTPLPTSPEWPYTPYRPSSSRGSRVYPRPSPTTCELGFRLDSAQQKCVDIDECSLSQHTCASEEDCVNIEGGFNCVCGTRCRGENEKPTYGPMQPAPRVPSDPGSNVITVGAQYGQRGPWSPRPTYSRDHLTGSIMTSCSWGYRLTPDKRCYDIDECEKNTSECGPQQRCENFYGGYSCQCPAGHKLVGRNDCGDIDECMHGNPCSYNSECVNTVGSYRCACTAGFRNAPSNDKVCVDVDECVDTPAVCHQGCANAWGSYRCYCKRGYRLDNDSRTCIDVNECEEWASVRLRGKLCGGECINEPGSYRCSCPSGYRLSEDQRNCIDIDECETGEATCARTSTPGYVCQNTPGSYHCHHIDCPAGYRLESKHRCKRIVQSCRVSDWSCLQQPSTYSYNFITFVSNIYLPKGSVDLFTMHGPAWVDSVVSFEMRMVSVQASPGVTPADLRCFDMRPSGSVCAISLLCSLGGPQVAELELTMSLYQHSQFAGSAVARLIIIVSQYEF